MTNSYESLINNSITVLLQPLYSKVDLKKDITDILINPDSSTYVIDGKGNTILLGKTLSGDDIRRIGTLLANLQGEELNENHPQISSSINNGKERFEILIPPIVKAPSLSLRLHKTFTYTLDTLIENGMLKRKEAELLTTLFLRKKNIVIAGETGSGKTTLLSALLSTLPKHERVIVIEEGVEEVNISLENHVRIITNKTSFTGRDAVISALRMNPDRIIYAEAREGSSALETLKAWRTGHSGGILTIHASNAKAIDSRLEDLLKEVYTSSVLNLIKTTIDVRVGCSIENGKRIVKEILYEDN